MKLASFINNSLADVKRTFKRFPVSLALAYIAGVSFMINIELHDFEDYSKLGITLLLGFVLTFAVDIYREVNKRDNTFRLIGYLGAAILMALLFVYELDLESTVTGFRLMFIFGTAYLVAMLAPFFGRKNSENGFWQFNVQMLISILLAYVYFGLLQIGVSALLASFEFLFDIGLHEELFLHTFVFLSTFGASTYVLGRVPKNLKSLDKVKDYPRVLEIITARIFVPVIGVYAVLVYAFVLKLLFAGQAPDYEVTFQVMAFSSVGVLAYLFAWPLKDKIKYIKHFYKYFFVYLVPLLAVLFVAIFKATLETGLTQTRYFVIAFGVIMTVWSFYYLFGKRKDIRLVHFFAGFISLFALFAPVVGAKPLALYSHTQIIQNGLMDSGIVVEGSYIDFDEELDLPKNTTESVRYVKRSYSEEDVDSILGQYDGEAKDEWIKKIKDARYDFHYMDRDYFSESRFLEEFDVAGYSKGYRFDVGRRMNNELSKIDNGILTVKGAEMDIDAFAEDLSSSDDLIYYDPAGEFVIYFENIWGEHGEVESAGGFVFVK